MSKLLSIYQNITQQLKETHHISWPKNLQQEQLDVQSQKISSEQLTKQLTIFAPTQGWYQTLDAVQTLALNGTLTLTPAERLICGEFINASGQSLHIRQQGNTIIATTYTPIEGQEKGQTLFSAKYKHLLQRHGTPNGQIAIYKLYWDINDPQQPKYSRFLKIQQEKKS